MSIGPKLTSNSLKQVFDRRSFVVGAMQGGIGLLLAARMGYIAVAENERWEMEAESNRVNLSLIPPRRGWILDRNGSPLASNRADFRVDIIPERLTNSDETVDILGDLLEFSDPERADLRDRIADSRGFSAVPVANGLDYDKFAAVSVRIPELPGVIPQRGFSRYYPTGPSVGHLIGYVGAPSREEYEEEPQPLLLTPGFKLGKDGIEKQFEEELRGEPGARRVEVTASGRIVRDLETREDVQGNAVQLTIDGPLQDYAARRIGLESGSVVVMDCLTGDLLCMASMPSFDPNSFSDGIGRLEYSMLRENERVPLRNKVLQGLYPPGSTVKPTVGMALLGEGIDPDETVFCGGGLRVGNRVFRCWNRSGHGATNLDKAIAQSCDVYFYAMAQRTGMDPIAQACMQYGMQERFDLPVVNQFFGTVPHPEWKMEKYGTEWQAFDTVNATIGQGYMLASPLQLAVMSARLATAEAVQPRLVLRNDRPQFQSMGLSEEYKAYVRQSMSNVVNGAGTAGRARLPIDDVLMAGKTGTAQVVGLNLSDGKTGPWRFRDHGLFIFFAPFDNPRYAGAVVIEHGGGSGSAYPIARDVMTYLFDPQKGLDALLPLEEQWGGTAQERLDRQYAQFAAAEGVDLPPAPPPVTLAEQVDAEARAAVAEPERAATDAFTPREEANPRADADEPPAAEATGT
ncbi:penicillin-binding protein 2 [Aurantiacibacter gangjinensis]|uniref:Penicillin-binding protein n=1 Tax=Aurantiacibacter gangjinensis TaxID=502682 RepID=A0A0G9MQ35_9SPHN|nr:penicillin-binding protein 2 [Aurantiacibacter gangjinensis]APE28682.1 Penicillin-binding protein 2 (PBP-2) [Aurantiacibacter gangjinensis]KLE32847.1 penicillin-binding protein [Aurantiacibacter gangjinensis]